MKLAVRLLILGLSIVGCSASAFAQNLELPQTAQQFCGRQLLRKVIGQESGGHISPIPAYKKETDRFLMCHATNIRQCG